VSAKCCPGVREGSTARVEGVCLHILLPEKSNNTKIVCHPLRCELPQVGVHVA
jgi:hypothetical protein